MLSYFIRNGGKKIRFARSFLNRRLIHVNLQLLYACNFRCHICSFWKEEFRNKPRLSVQHVELISEKLNEIGPQIISIGGGEPLLHPDLRDIVRALAVNHFPVMITNGFLMTPELARALFAAGMVEISVSVDYADPGKHDAQRGVPGAFAQAIKALTMLQTNRTQPEQRVHMIAVVMDDNLPDLGALIGRCRELGITFLVTLYSHSRGTKTKRAVRDDASRHLLELKANSRHFVALRGYLERFTEAMRTGGAGPCYAGRNLCNIDSQGNVTFCIDRLDESMGNILTEPMKTIEQRLLQRHQQNRCCDCWTSCRGSIEALLYGKSRLSSLWHYYQMTRPVPLRRTY